MTKGIKQNLSNVEAYLIRNRKEVEEFLDIVEETLMYQYNEYISQSFDSEHEDQVRDRMLDLDVKINKLDEMQTLLDMYYKGEDDDNGHY